MKDVAVLLAGGKGTRLYPISTEEKPKQFLPLLSNKPMIEESIHRIEPIFNPDSIFINSIEKYKGFLKKQPYPVLFEPYGVGTTASVLFIVLELMRKYGDCMITLLPSDHYIKGEQEYREAIQKAQQISKETETISLIGVKPDREETDFGYIKHFHGEVTGFKEKPDKEKAKEYIRNGYLWNSGIFVFKASMMYELYRKLLKDVQQGFQFAHSKGFLDSYYRNIEIKPKSFEKAIIEKTNRLSVIPAEFVWSDIGDIKRYQEIKTRERRGFRWAESRS